MSNMTIEKVVGREILDSRGNPTVEAEVYLADGTVAAGARLSCDAVMANNAPTPDVLDECKSLGASLA